ncbi:MAG: hypothetical protein IKL25_07680 [Clostridia bacterium]|nr:hypothetical protein [Clostridia bacterium]
MMAMIPEVGREKEGFVLPFLLQGEAAFARRRVIDPRGNRGEAGICFSLWQQKTASRKRLAVFVGTGWITQRVQRTG